MNSTKFQDALAVVGIITQLAIFPLVGVLWSLNNSIRDLRSFVADEFVRKDELPVLVAGINAGKHHGEGS